MKIAGFVMDNIYVNQFMGRSLLYLQETVEILFCARKCACTFVWNLFEVQEILVLMLFTLPGSLHNLPITS